MRTPSARMLPSLISVYNLPSWSRSTGSTQANTDTEGGFSAAYPQSPSVSDVPCSIQYVQNVETEFLGRITEMRLYHIFFATYVAVSPRDKLVWVDAAGNTRTAYVKSSKDLGFLGVLYRIEAVERL